MDTLMDRLNEAVFFIRQRTAFQPEYGIILGTGLGNLVKDIKVENFNITKPISQLPDNRFS